MQRETIRHLLSEGAATDGYSLPMGLAASGGGLGVARRGSRAPIPLADLH
jgi:hypothetical protein